MDLGKITSKYSKDNPRRFIYDSDSTAASLCGDVT
jgi:hypothetical protein